MDEEDITDILSLSIHNAYDNTEKKKHKKYQKKKTKDSIDFSEDEKEQFKQNTPRQDFINGPQQVIINQQYFINEQINTNNFPNSLSPNPANREENGKWNHRRSFNIIQQFQISPILVERSNSQFDEGQNTQNYQKFNTDGQYPELKKRRSSHQIKNMPVLVTSLTQDNKQLSSIKRLDRRYSARYGDLDNSPEFRPKSKKKHHNDQPSVINIGDLFLPIQKSQSKKAFPDEDGMYHSQTERRLLTNTDLNDNKIQEAVDNIQISENHLEVQKIEDNEFNENQNNNTNDSFQAKKDKNGSSTSSNMRSTKLGSNVLLQDEICADDAKKLRMLKQYDYFIILPDDNFKRKWDLLITILLLITAIFTPFRLAFYDQDSTPWVVIDSTIDLIFGIDIVLNFFMAYYDETEDIVDQRKKIVIRYLTGWFPVDIVSVFPISQVMNTGSYSRLARIARLPKLYRLIKVFRIILAKLQDDYTLTWIYKFGYQDQDNYAIYIASMYFVLTTFTTVGFGDIYANTPSERLFSILLMLIGVFSFSFAISSLSSMLSTLDTRNANLREKLQTLNKIRRDYRLGFEFYRRLKMALKYDHSRNAALQFGFLNELPQNLKIELSLIMHKEIIKKIYFFQDKPPHFIAFIGPLLKPLHIEEGNYVYKEKDPIEEIYFLIKGKTGLVHKDIKDSVYLIIEPGYYFGEIDFVFQNNDGKRKFTVKALEHSDLLTLRKQDLAKVDAEYEEIIADLFRHAQKRLKKTLKIQEESENYFLKKQIHPHRLSITQENQAVRRMSSAYKMYRKSSQVTGNKEGGESSPMKATTSLNQIDEEDEEEISENIKTDSTFVDKEMEEIKEQDDEDDEEEKEYGEENKSPQNDNEEEEKENVNNSGDENNLQKIEEQNFGTQRLKTNQLQEDKKGNDSEEDGKNIFQIHEESEGTFDREYSSSSNSSSKSSISPSQLSQEKQKYKHNSDNEDNKQPPFTDLIQKKISLSPEPKKGSLYNRVQSMAPFKELKKMDSKKSLNTNKKKKSSKKEKEDKKLLIRSKTTQYDMNENPILKKHFQSTKKMHRKSICTANLQFKGPKSNKSNNLQPQNHHKTSQLQIKSVDAQSKNSKHSKHSKQSKREEDNYLEEQKIQYSESKNGSIHQHLGISQQNSLGNEDFTKIMLSNNQDNGSQGSLQKNHNKTPVNEKHTPSNRNSAAIVRNELSVPKGTTLLDKLKIGKASQSFSIPKFQKTVNKAIIENKFKSIMINSLDKNKDNNNNNNQGSPRNLTEEQYHYNNYLKIKEIERNSRDLHEGVQNRLANLENSIVNIEKTLSELVTSQTQQQYSNDNQILLNFLMNAIEEIHNEQRQK